VASRQNQASNEWTMVAGGHHVVLRAGWSLASEGIAPSIHRAAADPECYCSVQATGREQCFVGGLRETLLSVDRVQGPAATEVCVDVQSLIRGSAATFLDIFNVETPLSVCRPAKQNVTHSQRMTV